MRRTVYKFSLLIALASVLPFANAESQSSSSQSQSSSPSKSTKSIEQIMQNQGVQGVMGAVGNLNGAMVYAAKNPFNKSARVAVKEAYAALPAQMMALAAVFHAGFLTDADLAAVQAMLGGFLDPKLGGNIESFVANPKSSSIPSLGQNFPANMMPSTPPGSGSSQSLTIDENAAKNTSSASSVVPADQIASVNTAPISSSSVADPTTDIISPSSSGSQTSDVQSYQLQMGPQYWQVVPIRSIVVYFASNDTPAKAEEDILEGLAAIVSAAAGPAITGIQEAALTDQLKTQEQFEIGIQGINDNMELYYQQLANQNQAAVSRAQQAISLQNNAYQTAILEQQIGLINYNSQLNFNYQMSQIQRTAQLNQMNYQSQLQAEQARTQAGFAQLQQSMVAAGMSRGSPMVAVNGFGTLGSAPLMGGQYGVSLGVPLTNRQIPGMPGALAVSNPAGSQALLAAANSTASPGRMESLSSSLSRAMSSSAAGGSTPTTPRNMNLGEISSAPASGAMTTQAVLSGTPHQALRSTASIYANTGGGFLPGSGEAETLFGTQGRGHNQGR